jgi:uncharacterized protein YjiS (DUF1127 family)
MAYLLSGEQPRAAAVSVHPLRALARWFGKHRAARAQRMALSTLLEFDASRLDDLGINRQDLFDALHHPSERPEVTLARRREIKSSAWLTRR